MSEETALERYRRLVRRYDAARQEEEKPLDDQDIETLLDELDEAWFELSAEERVEAGDRDFDA